MSAAAFLKSKRQHERATAILEAFKANPAHEVAVETATLRIILLRTNGRFTDVGGTLHDITSKSLGAGVYRVTATVAS